MIDVAEEGAPKLIKCFTITNNVYFTDKGLLLKQYLKGLQ